MQKAQRFINMVTAERDQALARERALLDSNKDERTYLMERNAAVHEAKKLNAERDASQEAYGRACDRIDTLAAQLAEARSKIEMAELMAKEVGVLARNAALDEAIDVCMSEAREFSQGTEIDECSKIALHDAAARIRALKSEPAPRQSVQGGGDLSTEDAVVILKLCGITDLQATQFCGRQKTVSVESLIAAIRALAQKESE
jgi:phosphoribosyl-dephospho-CoA transferase